MYCSSSASCSELPPLFGLKELGINNAQYGVISSAVSLVNTGTSHPVAQFASYSQSDNVSCRSLPVLPLFSGVLIDYYGPNIGSLTASSFIFVGQGLAAIG